ncbi:MAG: glycosyltransferase [Actinomycetia bacterium]|nr:glycosyltransferase [Actinomycetes bacterium]
MVKIAIYDRYLSTAGGGERYSCKMAEILSSAPGYAVNLITDLYADLDDISQKLNLDLSKVGLKVFPYISDDYTRKLTGEYDLFVNATYLSALPAYGRKNIYLCYFPTPFDVDFKFIHRFLLFFFRLPAIWLFRLAGRMTGGFTEIKVEEGIYEPKRFMLRRGSWTSGRAVLEVDGNGTALGIKNPARSLLDIMKVKVEAYSLKHGPDKGRAKKGGFKYETELLRGEKKTVRILVGGVTGKPESGKYRIIITSDIFTPSAGHGASGDSRMLGAAIYNESRTNPFKKAVLKILGYIPLFLVTYPKNNEFLDTYQKIISISKYSDLWSKRLWNRKSTILFPPVDTESFAAGVDTVKEKAILSVGRFFPEHHNKKQYELAGIFIKMLADYPEDMKGYKLYLAGGVADRPEHTEYVERIKKLAEGHPIEIMANISFKKLAGLFKKASIFWHGAGLGEDEDSHPEKFEHFGITTIEAMSAGCILVVINKGGQKEIIKDGIDGFFFEDLEGLSKITLDIIRGEKDPGPIRKNAVQACKRFSNDIFEEELLSIIKEAVRDIT